MANNYSPYRRTNLFGPKAPDFGARMKPPTPYTRSELFDYQEEPEEDEDMKFFRDFQEIQSKMKGGPARTAYMQTLQEQPTAEQYAPSKMRRFGGALAGIAGGIGGGVGGGIEAAKEITEAPYRTAMQDWSTRLAGQGQAAKMEQEDFESQAKTLQFGATLGLNRKKFESEDAARRARIELDRARAQKLMSPEYDKIEQANGDIMLINKNNPNDRQLIDADTAAGLRARAAGVSAGARVTSANAAMRSAGAAERNAATNEGRLSFDRDVQFPYNQSRDIVNRNVDIWDKSRTLPTQSSRATEEVLKGLAQDAAFSPYVTIQNGFPYLTPNVNTATPSYRKFWEEYQKRLQRYTTEGGIGAITEPPFPGRYKITPEP